MPNISYKWHCLFLSFASIYNKIITFHKSSLFITLTYFGKITIFRQCKKTPFKSVALAIIFFLLGVLVIKLAPLIKSNYYEQTKKWERLKNSGWGDAFELVKITSTLDQKIQNAYFLPSTEKKPLLVSLHTWSGNYYQKDPLADLALQNKWNYIHPDFRGENNSTESCLSSLVVSDVDDAIQYAIDNSNVDVNNIFIVGASGGGYVTLGTYLRTKHKIKRFIAWVPISDLSAWYHQSLSIGNTRFSNDIIACTSSGTNTLDKEEAKKRSPLFWTVASNNNAQLDIYAGIHDGHKKGGSVPISHSLLFFNHLLSSSGLDEQKIKPQIISSLLTRDYKVPYNAPEIQGKAVIYQKVSPKGTLTVFEGGHEMLSEYTFKKIILLSK